MQSIFVGICFFGTVTAAIFLKSQDLSGGLTAAVIIPLVFLTIYSLARIQPARTDAKKVSDMEPVAETFEKKAHA